jgi:hypothetical protein
MDEEPVDRIIISATANPDRMKVTASGVTGHF